MLCLQRRSLLRQFEGQHLANLLWGLTRSGFKPLPDFLQLLAQVGVRCTAGWVRLHCRLGLSAKLACGTEALCGADANASWPAVVKARTHCCCNLPPCLHHALLPHRRRSCGCATSSHRS